MSRPAWVDPLADRLRSHLPGRFLLRLAKFFVRRFWPAIRRLLGAVYRRLWPVRYVLRGLASRARRKLELLRYEQRLKAGRAAGDWTYLSEDWSEVPQARVDLFFIAGDDPARLTRRVGVWCENQTLDEYRAVGLTPVGEEKWRIVRSGVGPAAVCSDPAPWFYAPGELEEVYPSFLESALLVALAEDVDAVVLLDRLVPLAVDDIESVHGNSLRRFTLYHRRAYTFDTHNHRVRPIRDQRLVKVIGDAAPDDHDPSLAQSPKLQHRYRRGPYLASYDLGPRLSVPVRDAAAAGRWPVEDSGVQPRYKVIVYAPFLAHGGAEHTLFETLRALKPKFDFTFVTLAPHRPELGDRRQNFEEISPRIYALGDLVHPIAMPDLLSSLITKQNASILYNANGTTLFYDFIGDLKAKHPNLRVLDHLYDHEIGYIDRYAERDLRPWINAVVAENHRIADKLVREHQWPPHRVPVIWPCGRRDDAFPAPETVPDVRSKIRQELGYEDADIIFLTAARMHAQKRPLDLVSLAARLTDVSQLHFLIVGGGDLEHQVDEAIANHPGVRVRRLPFRRDIPNLIAACDVGCLVSDYEGLPVFMIECLQLGRPFLGTRVGEMGRVLEETKAGLVVENPGDLATLEAAVRRLLNADLRAERASKAREAAQEFAVTTCAERYADAFLGWNQK